MKKTNSTWTKPEEIDRLISDSHPDEVMQQYGHPLPERKSGNNYRLECPVEECDSANSSYGQLSVELSSPYRIKCFSCGVQGKLFELMWILKHRKQPDGGKVRGEEFKEMLGDLKAFRGAPSVAPVQATTTRSTQSPTRDSVRPNLPMSQSDNERTRAQADLWKRGVLDPAEMSPAASRYFRQRPFLSLEVCQRWGISFVTGKSTLRNRIVYRIDDVQGRALAYAGRDPDYDANLAEWKRTRKGKEPIKIRFPSEEYFRKGLELYGQQKDRLRDREKLDLVRQTGVWLVEGFNDVLNLDFYGQPSVGAMFNRLTRQQAEKLIRFVEATGAPGVAVGFDRDKRGIEGQSQVLAMLAKHVSVIDLWGEYHGDVVEPEQMNEQIVRQAQQWAKSKWRC